MNTEKQRAFIIHCLYYGIALMLIYFFLRYAIYWLMPFVIGFGIAFMLQPLIRFLYRTTHLPKKCCAFIVFVLFTITIGACITYLCFKGYLFAKDLIIRIPDLYNSQFEPAFSAAFAHVEGLLNGLPPEVAVSLQTLMDNFSEIFGELISAFSKGILNMFTGFASSLPNGIVGFFFTFLASFFFSFDYQKITSFVMRQFNERGKQMLLNIKSYISGSILSLFVAYMKLMALTFIELAIGLTFLDVENAVIIAFLIALFDLLPIFGTGGIMIPWIIYVFFVNQTKFAVGLLILYLIITLIRNLLEPRIVGKQLGMHPLLMLLCMYLGARLFGFLGIFLMPMLVIILINLNEHKLIHLYR